MRRREIPWKQGAKILGLLVILLLTTASLYGRAGGAGGSSSGGGFSSSSGGGGGIIQIVYLIIRLPFPFNAIIVVAVVGVGIYGARKKSQEGRAFTSMTQGERTAGLGAKKLSSLDLPDQAFDSDAFLAKVKTAFLGIQSAWSQKDLGPVRRYISDGIHQRFKTQFAMMDLLDQENTISDVRIVSSWIEDTEVQGSYQIAHVGIRASIVDRFRSPHSFAPNSGGREEFVEYWSFIRRNNASGGDLYSSTSCPNCGGVLENEQLDVASCAYCKTLLNNGNYDWVLSEITQVSDWASSQRSAGKLDGVASKVAKRFGAEDFAVQLLEDKASNGYLHIKSALATGKPELMRRFVTGQLYDRLVSASDDPIAYNRFYLNHVTLLGAGSDQDHDLLYVAIKSSYQRVRLPKGRKPQLMDSYMAAHTEVVVFERSKDAKPLGSLYAEQCPSCGGPVEDASATECAYCGQTYNSGKNDWVIGDIISLQEYQARQQSTDVGVKAQHFDNLYHYKDYVLNNVMFIIAADGTFADEERVMAEHLVKAMGYSSQKLQPLFDQARSGRLVIRMPSDPRVQQKIYELMEKFARADGIISPEEETVLEQVRESISQP